MSHRKWLAGFLLSWLCQVMLFSALYVFIQHRDALVFLSQVLSNVRKEDKMFPYIDLDMLGCWIVVIINHIVKYTLPPSTAPPSDSLPARSKSWPSDFARLSVFLSLQHILIVQRQLSVLEEELEEFRLALRQYMECACAQTGCLQSVYILFVLVICLVFHIFIKRGTEVKRHIWIKTWTRNVTFSIFLYIIYIWDIFCMFFLVLVILRYIKNWLDMTSRVTNFDSKKD